MEAEVRRSLGRNVVETSQTEIIRRITCMEAPRFYVSEEKVRRHLVRRMTGKPLEVLTPIRMEMYNELYRRVTQLLLDRQTMTLWEAIERVVVSPAPRLYLSPKSVCNILSLRRTSARAKATV